MSVRRIFVEKKPEYAVRAKELRQEIENYLGIGTITDVRVLIRYDVEDVSEEVYKEALVTIFLSRRWTLYMKKAFRLKREIPYLPLNTCLGSLIREQTLLNNV